MLNSKNQNLNTLGYLLLGVIMCLTLMQSSATEKAENKEGEYHNSSQFREETKEPNKQDKLSALEYYKKHTELLSKASEALPKNLLLYLMLYLYNPD